MAISGSASVDHIHPSGSGKTSAAGLQESGCRLWSRLVVREFIRLGRKRLDGNSDLRAQKFMDAIGDHSHDTGRCPMGGDAQDRGDLASASALRPHQRLNAWQTRRVPAHRMIRRKASHHPGDLEEIAVAGLALCALQCVLEYRTPSHDINSP
jgi:hypothetical protein